MNQSRAQEFIGNIKDLPRSVKAIMAAGSMVLAMAGCGGVEQAATGATDANHQGAVAAANASKNQSGEAPRVAQPQENPTSKSSSNTDRIIQVLSSNPAVSEMSFGVHATETVQQATDDMLESGQVQLPDGISASDVNSILDKVDVGVEHMDSSGNLSPEQAIHSPASTTTVHLGDHVIVRFENKPGGGGPSTAE